MIRDLLRRLFRRRLNDELDEELQFHMERRAELNRQEGMTPEEARLAARRQFGNALLIREDARRVHVSVFIERTLQDLHHASRSFVRTPMFTLVAVLSIALGVGSSTAVFSVVDRILFKSLPYADDTRLVSVAMTAPVLPKPFLLGTDYVEWTRSQTPFQAFTSTSGIRDCDVTETNPIRLRCAQLESTFLSTFGIQPQLGRMFTPEEDRPKAPKVVLISDGLWHSRFAASPGVLEKTFSLDGQAQRIVGVLPKNFELPTLEHADIVVPQTLPLERQVRPNTGQPLEAFARLKPGVTADQARAALEPLFRESLKWIPPQFVNDVKLNVRSVREAQVAGSRRTSQVLLASVFAVLLVACANVANLMLARATSREREFAVRAALGAGRGSLIRQTFSESLLLAGTGGALGCGLGYALLRLLSSFAPEGVPRLAQATLDGRVLMFALATTVGSGLLVGLVPAFQSVKPETLVGWRTVSGRRTWLRPVLVASQIAGSLILLTVASLLLRSLWNLQAVPVGVRIDNIVTASIVLGAQRYPGPEKQGAFFEQIEKRMASVPGVEFSAIADSVAPDPPALTSLLAHVQPEGQERPVEGTGGAVSHRDITPQYFAALGIPILSGRGFSEEDRVFSGERVVLSESLARFLFPNEDAVGKRISVARGPDPNGRALLEVIGVVANVKNSSLVEADLPEEYHVRKYGSDMSGIPPEVRRCVVLIVRSAIRTNALAGIIRSEVAAIDETVPVTIDTMTQKAAHLTDRPRFSALLLTLFASISLMLAAVGIYGVVAFLVAQRTQEIGVRMAIGAQKKDILRLVVGQAARWTATGIVIGLPVSLYASQLLGGLLFQVSQRDLRAFTAATLLLAATALIAALIPSIRATRVDPVIALRRE